MMVEFVEVGRGVHGRVGQEYGVRLGGVRRQRHASYVLPAKRACLGCGRNVVTTRPYDVETAIDEEIAKTIRDVVRLRGGHGDATCTQGMRGPHESEGRVGHRNPSSCWRATNSGPSRDASSG